MKITLPDKSIKELPKGVTGLDVALSIGPGLAKSAIAVSIDGIQKDLSDPIDIDCALSVITVDSEEGLEIMRHTTAAQVLALAIKNIYPDAKLAIGPTIENGFYYDFLTKSAISSEDLPKIEKEMKKIVMEKSEIRKSFHDEKNATAKFKKISQDYKVKIIEESDQTNDFQIYENEDVNFLDLCRGPHLPNLSHIGVFKLTKVSGAYWKGDSSNEMLTRIYGTAWRNKKELDEYMSQLEEAEKRDHRRIGKDQDLFSIQEDAGGGLVFWHPNGAKIRHIIEKYWKEEHEKADYELLYTPHIALDSLWQTSGHTDFYEESMFKPIDDENQSYRLKPMNCPCHVLVYKDKLRSYRDLPIRWAELGTVYRKEMTGALHGLMRVRGFTQDDSHIFCSEEQIEHEINEILELAINILNKFTFTEFEIHLATRPEKYVGSKDIWDKATQALIKALEAKNLSYEIDEGGGAFYGPKIDIHIEDAIGRLWQCTTVQFDFNLPERFGLKYISSEGEEVKPIMIHRALLGSVERFFGVLVEHFAGAFPLWLSPLQIVIIPIADRHLDYCNEVSEKLRNANFRAEVNDSPDRMNSKIRQAQKEKIPYMIIIGDNEIDNDELSIRSRAGENQNNIKLEQFIERLSDE